MHMLMLQPSSLAHERYALILNDRKKNDKTYEIRSTRLQLAINILQHGLGSTIALKGFVPCQQFWDILQSNRYEDFVRQFFVV